MKLAEALILRKDLQTRLVRIQERLNANVLVQEGDRPSEDPAELIKRLNETCAELNTLICRINKTNSGTLMDGRPLADAITERDRCHHETRPESSQNKHPAHCSQEGRRPSQPVLSKRDPPVNTSGCPEGRKNRGSSLLRHSGSRRKDPRQELGG